MSRQRPASRVSVLLVALIGLALQAPPAAVSQPVAPRFHPTSDVSSRLAEAAQDPTLAPWQREFMLEVAQGRPERAAVEPSPALPGLALPSAGSAADEGAWIEFFTPSARVGHTAIYDPVRDRMVVFGGYDGSHRNDVWALSLSGSPAWSELDPAGGPPPERRGHTAIYDPARDRMVMFGGYHNLSTYNDVWALSLSGSPAWSELDPVGSPPAARHDHTAIYDPVRDRMVVFGGYDGSFHNDAWALSLAGSPAWGVLAPAGGPPTARFGHTAIYDPARDRMVVFGGVDANSDFDCRIDVWALSLAGNPAWSALAPAGSPPSGCFGHTAIYDPARDRMVVFGGRFGAGNGMGALSLAGSPAWGAFAAAGGPPPTHGGHTAVYDPVRDRMVVFGGHDSNDAWALSLEGSPTVSVLAPAAIQPTWRSGHTAIYDPVRDRMVVFGGYDGSYYNDVWALSLTGRPAWNALAPAGTPPSGRDFHTAIYDPVRDRMVVFGGFHGRFYNDVWALSLAGSPVWSALAPAGSPPAARQHHTAIYDPARDRMVVFGGVDQHDPVGLRNDVWALSLAGSPAWSTLATAESPPSARFAHAAFYDPVRDRMVVFGGRDGGGFRSDVWALSLSGNPIWSALVSAGTPPPALGYHPASYDPVRDRMVVFGGYDGGGYRNDTWALSLAGSPVWSTLAPAGSRPTPRYGHTAIYDPVRDRLVVFGGSGNSSRYDTWGLAWSAPTPALVALAHAEAEPDRVSLAWYGSESAGLTASVERREVTTAWQRLATISADGTGMFRYDDRAVTPGARYAYRLAYQDGEGAETVTAETWVDVPVAVSLALDGLRPNPAAGELVAVFALPDDAPAVLRVLDVTGRRVLTRDVGSLGAGRHTLRLGHARELRAGIYWLHLDRKDRALLAKAIVLR